MGENNNIQPSQNPVQPQPVVPSIPNQPIPQPVITNSSRDFSSPESGFPKAGFIVRWAAGVLDGLLLAVPILIISIPFYKSDDQIVDTLSGLIFMVYSVVAIANYQTTLGKNFFYLKVVSKDGSKIGYGKAVIREFFGKIISSLVFSLGYLWIIWDKEKQGWHDKIAGTYVVQQQEMSKGKKVLAYALVFVLPTIALLGILGAIILVAVNPVKQMEKAKEAQERMEKQRLEQELRMQELDNLQRN